MEPWLSGLMGAALSGASAAPAHGWIRDRRYRYEDEQEVRPIRMGWVLPLTLVLGGLLGVAWADRPALAVVLALSCAWLVVLAAVDVDVLRLPDVITKPLMLAVPVALLGAGLIEGEPHAGVRAVLAAVCLGVVYLILVIFGRGTGMGLGDAKLAPTLGALLGYLSWTHVYLGTLLGFASGAGMALLLMLRGSSRKSHLSFGPHMIAGAMLLLVAPALTALLAR